MATKLSLISKKDPFDYKPSSRKDKGLLEWLNQCISEASMFCEPEHARLEENNRYERGFQWSDGDAQRQQEKDRPALPLNDISKNLSAVANREILDRYMPKVFGRESADDGVAELLDELSRWQRDMAETEHEESRAFRSTCGSGYGVMHKWWNEAANDGHGAIVDEEVPLWTMLWDPRARKQNMVDRRYHISGKYVPVEEIIDQFGDSVSVKKKIKAMVGAGGKGNGAGPSGTSVSNSRWGWRDVAGGRWFISAKKELFLVEVEWLEQKPVWKVSMPERWDEWVGFLATPEGSVVYGADEAGQPLSVTTQQYSQMDDEGRKALAAGILADSFMKVVEDKDEFSLLQEQYLEWTGFDIEFSKKMKEEVHFAIVTKDVILRRGVRTTGFTYEFITGIPFEQRDGMRFYGFVDMAKGPQDFKNVLYSNLLTQYMASPKSSLIMEEGLIANPNQFLNDYAKVGGVMFVPDGVVGQLDTRSKIVETHGFNPMNKELLMIVESGVEGMLGLSSIESGTQGDLRRVGSKVAEQANKASSTILAIYFDSLKRYRKRWGMLNVKFLQTAYTTKDMARIVGGDVAEAISMLDEWPEINRFDVKVEENPTTVSEQMDAVRMLISSGTLDKWTDGASPKMAFTDAVDMMVTMPKSVREKIKKNSKQMDEYSSQIQQLQSELKTKEEQIALRDQWLLSVDRGGQLKTAWETMYQMAMEIDRQRQEMQQQEEEGAEQSPIEGIENSQA